MDLKDSNNFKELINQASRQTGVNKKDLEDNINNGKLENILSKLNPQDAQKIQNVLANPEMFKQMLNTPQAQMIIKNFANKDKK